MTRINQIAVTAAILLAPLVISGPVFAVEGEVNNTGPGSTNEVDVNQTYTCKVNNENNVTIESSTGQGGYSGDVEVTDNTEGGDSKSGSVKNESGTTFNVTIKNGDSCDVAVVPAVTPETPETPAPETPAPGKGEAAAPVQPAQKVTPTALPVTSGDTAPTIFLAGSIALTGVLALVYRRLF